MTSPLPHDPYAHAVMAALDAAGLLDPDESWTEYASDNGTVMIMETVIGLSTDRARAAGWSHGVTLLWNQIGGWSWGPNEHTAGRLQYVEPLIAFTIVPDPADVARAAAILLDDDKTQGRLPIARASSRPPATTIPRKLQELLDQEIDDEDAPTEKTLRELAAYYS